MNAGFFILSLISISTILLTSYVTYEILHGAWSTLLRIKIAPRMHVLFIIGPIFIAHMINIWIYGAVYFLVENYTALGELTGHIEKATLTLQSFESRLYFSASTYASLGLGEIVPKGSLRMLASAEVLHGLIMIGWTVSLTYLAMEKFWSMPVRKKDI
ncbi:MAG: ion channel [Pseudomonadota bacterium]